MVGTYFSITGKRMFIHTLVVNLGLYDLQY